MTPEEIYLVARQAGFPASTAVKMVAIALKESGGNPGAYNGVPPDDSYGLWQINMIGNLGVARLAEFGLYEKTDLFDPATNARAALSIWNGNDSNLARHWYIDRGVNMQRFQQYLPVAQAAAASIEPGQAEMFYVDPASSNIVLGALLVVGLLWAMRS